MEEVPANQPHQQDRSTKKIRSFEIIFIPIVLVLLLGILNYFNVLKLSRLFPNQLNFLPHISYEEPQNQKVPPARQSFPTFSPNSATFAYDTSKANSLLSNYLRDKIKSDYLPSKIEVKHKLIASNKQEGTDYEFGSNWTIDNVFFQSNFHYEPDTNNPRDMQFSIQLQNIKETSASASLTKALSDTYLKTASESTNFVCGISKNTISFCENFQTTVLGKEGFGLIIAKAQPNNTVFVFSCFIPKDSKYFSIRTSCLLFNEKGSK